MEVQRTINEYVEDIKGKQYIYESQKEALVLLYDYCNDTELQMPIHEIDSNFFDEFLMYWLPKNQNRLTEQKVYQLLQTIHDYCAYIQNIYDTPKLKKYEIMGTYTQECLRIYRLKRLFAKYLDDPIIHLHPLIVDLHVYKKRKAKESIRGKQGVREQGLFEVQDINFDNTIGLKRLSDSKYIRVIIDDPLIIYIRKGDILHLRVKRKQFLSYWEIEELKYCYLAKAQQYLMQ